MITENDIINYLEERFAGVAATTEGITKRYKNYVQYEFANSLLERITPYLQDNSIILDIGSGWGSFIYLLRSKGYKAYGIEIQDFLVNYARQRIDSLPLKMADSSEQIYLKESALHLPFTDSNFDIVTLWNVLEHIEDYEGTIKETIRVLKSGGKIFISNVNYASCFIEPHYRVLWFPMMPKKLASIYLKMRGRNPDYLQNGIFYISNWALIRMLLKSGMAITNERIERLKDPSSFIVSPYKRFVWNLASKFKVKTFIIGVIKIMIFNPFCSNINIIAIKK